MIYLGSVNQGLVVLVSFIGIIHYLYQEKLRFVIWALVLVLSPVSDPCGWYSSFRTNPTHVVFIQLLVQSGSYHKYRKTQLHNKAFVYQTNNSKM